VTGPGPLSRPATPAEITAIEKQAAQALARLDVYIAVVSAWLRQSLPPQTETVTMKGDLL